MTEENLVMMVSLATAYDIDRIFALGINCEFQPASAAEWSDNKNVRMIIGASDETLRDIKETMILNRTKPEFFRVTKLPVELTEEAKKRITDITEYASYKKCFGE